MQCVLYSVSVVRPLAFDFSKWHLRVTLEGRTCVRARSKVVPELLFQEQGAFGMLQTLLR
jgi:hypothetical protein